MRPISFKLGIVVTYGEFPLTKAYITLNIGTFNVHFHMSYKHQTLNKGNLGWRVSFYQVTCSCAHVRSGDKIKLLFLRCKHQTWLIGDLEWQAHIHLFRWPTPQVVTQGHTKTLKFCISFSSKLIATKLPNIQRFRSGVTGSELPSHITIWLQDHMKKII